MRLGRVFGAPVVLLVVVTLVAVGNPTAAILLVMVAGWSWLFLTLMIRWERTLGAPPDGGASV